MISTSPAGPPGTVLAQRRTRALTLAVGLGALAVLGHAVFIGPPPDAPGAYAVRGAGLFALLSFSVLLLGALLRRLQLGWHQRLRGALVRAGEGFWNLTRRLVPRPPAHAPDSPPMRLGERIALVAGLCLTALDVVLTTLLLRDVFPEPPYRFDLFGLLSPESAEWSFYAAVAIFKAVLEVWFGVYDTIRGGSSLRWFVLGGASAFDAALAASRGMVLAEQGIVGASVMVSNIIFIGFGLAVPWVAAHTGGLLVSAMDGWLARLGVLRLISALPRILLLGALWLVAIAIGAPILALVLGLGLLVAVWSALDDVIATILGHDDGAQALALPSEVLRAADDAHSAPNAPLQMTAGGVP